jgi:hypothetical protein
MKSNQVIMLEFNELCPQLLNEFIARGMLPNFGSLRDQAHVFTTDAEEDGERLNPWVQWVSVHSGLTADEHRVETLSESSLTAGKNVWDLLSSAGYKVWICGSMNAGYTAPLNGFLLPDPWSSGVDPYPREAFDGYWGFVRNAVQEHSNDSTPMTTKAALDFLRYMIGHGLTSRTGGAIVKQLMSERIANCRWRRACIMDLLQLDLFRHFWRLHQPNFATFFLNSTAHLQHCYWRHWEPDVFEVRPSAAELRDYGDAIPYGYRAMDRLVGKLVRLVGPDATIVFATGLSQQPYLRFEQSGGRNYYRPRSGTALREGLGLAQPHTFEPVMAEQFYLRFGDSASADQAERLLESFVVEDLNLKTAQSKRALHFERRDGALLVQCNCTHAVGEDAVLRSKVTGRECRFFEIFYRLDALKSGQHHPSGALWIRQPDRVHTVYSDPVSIRSIAPTILHWFDIPAPSSMETSAIEAVLDRRKTVVSLRKVVSVANG